MKKLLGALAIVILLVLAAIGYWYVSNQKPVASSPPPPTPTSTPAVSAPTKKTYATFPEVLAPDQLSNKKAVIQLVTKGFFEIELYAETPKATSNFIALSQDKFYDKKVFYKVTPGSKVEGGSEFVDGREGVTYQFEDELSGRKIEKGSVAMVNIGPNTNGSRFFIVLGDEHQLDPKYTIIGKVINGQEVVDRIQEGDMIETITIKNR